MKRDKEDIRKVNLKGYPNAENFHPHGMYISNKTDLLYVTNHVQTYSGVEIFKIDYSNSPDTITLLHQHTVKSELFLPYAPNDVVEGKGKGELYVTMWLPLDILVEEENIQRIWSSALRKLNDAFKRIWD